MNQDISSYYKERAKEYNKVYQIPEEQDDLIKATELFQQLFADKSVLEIACGTGYWTEQIARTASSVFATDVNEAMIDIAKTRSYCGNVSFKICDMYQLAVDRKFDGLFGGFIWSHILLQDLDEFLFKLQDHIIETGQMVFIDSKQVKGSSHDKKRTIRVDAYGNAYQTRRLENGTEYEVLKNFPDHQFLRDKLSQIGTDIAIFDLTNYWIAGCKVKSN